LVNIYEEVYIFLVVYKIFMAVLENILSSSQNIYIAKQIFLEDP